jgi:hypothetical protein
VHAQLVRGRGVPGHGEQAGGAVRDAEERPLPGEPAVSQPALGQPYGDAGDEAREEVDRQIAHRAIVPDPLVRWSRGSERPMRFAMRPRG